MATFRPKKQAQAEYFRQQDRDLDSGKPMVYVIQERRALREMARELGVEFLVGDEEPKRKKKRLKKSQGPDLIVSLEKAGNAPVGKTVETAAPHQSDAPHADGQERWPHKYIKRYKGQDGNWVYVYSEAQSKEPGFKGGFAKTPEPTPRPPEVGIKRARVSGDVEKRSKNYRSEEGKKQYGDWKAKVGEMLRVPGATQDVMKEALAKVGPSGFEAEYEKTKEHFNRIKHPQDEALMVEHTARTIVGTAGHEDAQVEKTEPSPYARRPGGFTPSDPNLRHPWQLTANEFEERKKIDPRLMGTDYKNIITAAMNRGEYVPVPVLTQKTEHSDREQTPAEAAAHPWLADAAEKYLKDQKPEFKMSTETEAYVGKFQRLTESLPKKFDDWVSAEAKKEGDSYLTRTKASGYDIDSYDVTDTGIYAHMLQHPGQVVLYHMYAQHKDHGTELLAALHEHGIDSEYTVVRRASAVIWDPSWGPTDKEQSTRDLPDGKQIAYSSDFVLAFKPKDHKQSEALVSLLHDLAHRGASGKPHQAIHRSWEVPDVRATKKVDHYEELHLNIKSVGGHDLSILTRHDWIRSGDAKYAETTEEAQQDAETRGDYDPEFRREKLFVDGDLAGYVKSFEALSQISVGEVVVVDF